MIESTKLRRQRIELRKRIMINGKTGTVKKKKIRRNGIKSGENWAQ